MKILNHFHKRYSIIRVTNLHRNTFLILEFSEKLRYSTKKKNYFSSPLLVSYFIKRDMSTSCCLVLSANFQQFLFMINYERKITLIQNLASLKSTCRPIGLHTWTSQIPTQFLNGYLIPSNTSNLNSLWVK